MTAHACIEQRGASDEPYGAAIALDFAVTLPAVAVWASAVQGIRSNGALVEAYQNNPSLNAQPASLRAIEENVPLSVVSLR
jgi:hypothetical protein